MDDNHMWLTPFRPAAQWIKITFDSPIVMRAMRIWNYNKSLDDTARGIKCVKIFVDDVCVTPSTGIFLRKGMSL